MPFRFVHIQNLLYLQIQLMVAVVQPLGKILVNRGLGDSKVAGGSADGGAVFDDVHGQFAGPFFHVVSQSQHSLHIVLKNTMCRA